MKVKAKELLASSKILEKIFNSPMDKAKVAYALVKIKKSIDSELKNIDDTRIKLVDKYAEKDESGKPKVEEKDGRSVFVLTDPKAFDEAYNKFLDETEVEIDTWKIPFEAVERLNLSVTELGMISYILKDPEEK